MIDFVFTIDYEIYGNGEGCLQDLVYKPTRRLMTLFKEAGVRFVTFVEVAELEKIEEYRSDNAIVCVRDQVKELHEQGFEIGLHLHPQWCNGQYQDGRWSLDSREYNLCTLTEERISQIVGQSVAYLRHLLADSNYVPLSFRAGNWLFQPTAAAASVLAKHGLRVDSSVFKGGLQHGLCLDYRRALKNGYYWSFSQDVTVPDRCGPWLEVPVYTEMVPFWKMITRKRLASQGRSGSTGRSFRHKINRCRDLVRPRYPLKLDFCRMTLDELKAMTEKIIHDDQASPGNYRPIVAIGHSKDLFDFETVERFLQYLWKNEIGVVTFKDVLPTVRLTPLPA